MDSSSKGNAEIGPPGCPDDGSGFFDGLLVGGAVSESRRPLWAPWRVEYIRSAGRTPRGCIFCATEPPESDEERLILFRGESVFVLLNRFPYAAGHLMVAPLAHVGALDALDAATQGELMTRIAQSAAILRKTYDCQGMNIGANLGEAAGAGFADHLHFHLVPRWSGDTNFMTALAEIRVIPEHLQRTWEQLRPAFEELART